MSVEQEVRDNEEQLEADNAGLAVGDNRIKYPVVTLLYRYIN